MHTLWIQLLYEQVLARALLASEHECTGTCTLSARALLNAPSIASRSHLNGPRLLAYEPELFIYFYTAVDLPQPQQLMLYAYYYWLVCIFITPLRAQQSTSSYAQYGYQLLGDLLLSTHIRPRKYSTTQFTRICVRNIIQFVRGKLSKVRVIGGGCHIFGLDKHVFLDCDAVFDC